MPQTELNERNDIHEVGRSLNSEMMKDISFVERGHNQMPLVFI